GSAAWRAGTGFRQHSGDYRDGHKMTHASQHMDDSFFSAFVRSVIQAFRAPQFYKWAAITVVFAGGLVGGGIALMLPNQYTSSATFIAQGAQTLALPSVLQGAVVSLGLERGSDYSPKF